MDIATTVEATASAIGARAPSNATGSFVGMSEATLSNIGNTNSNMTVQVEFGATNASQAITSNGSIFERIGPS